MISFNLVLLFSAFSSAFKTLILYFIIIGAPLLFFGGIDQIVLKTFFFSVFFLFFLFIYVGVSFIFFNWSFKSKSSKAKDDFLALTEIEKGTRIGKFFLG